LKGFDPPGSGPPMPMAGPSAQDGGQLAHHPVHVHGEGGLLHEVLKLVAGQEHLGKGDHVRARIARLLPMPRGRRRHWR
jgi:hypothetical protein